MIFNRGIEVEYKDVTESKITVTQCQIRIKISTQKSKEKQEADLMLLFSYADYFQKVEYPVTARFVLMKNKGLRLSRTPKESVGMSTCYISYEQLGENNA